MKKPIPGRSSSPLPVNLRKFSQIFHLAANFREYLHAQDTRRHSAPLLTARFHTHNGCSAAHPSLLAASHLLRQNQNHLQRASFAETRVAIQKNPAAAQVTRAAAGFNRTLLRLDRDRQSKTQALLRPALMFGFWHGGGRVPHSGWERSTQLENLKAMGPNRDVKSRNSIASPNSKKLVRNLDQFGNYRRKQKLLLPSARGAERNPVVWG